MGRAESGAPTRPDCDPGPVLASTEDAWSSPGRRALLRTRGPAPFPSTPSPASFSARTSWRCCASDPVLGDEARGRGAPALAALLRARASAEGPLGLREASAEGAVDGLSVSLAGEMTLCSEPLSPSEAFAASRPQRGVGDFCFGSHLFLPLSAASPEGAWRLGRHP